MIKFNKIINITFIGIIFICALSCKQEDFLETTNKANLTDATVWVSEGNADIFLNDCYADLEQKSSLYDDLDDFSDNSYILGSATSVNWRKGLIDPSPNNYTSSRGLYGPAQFVNWPGTYTKIRKLNTFIQNVNENATNFSPEYLAKRIDEAKFLRAYFYSELFMNIGGLSIITEPQGRTTMTESELYVARSSFEETFNFIVSELDAIVDNGNLEVKYNNGDADAGRATLGASLALKGWIQLFAASPAYNSSTPAVPPSPDNLQSFASYDPARWADAAATNRKFIETYGHKGTGTYNLFPKMTEFWWEANEYNEEVIWDRQQVSMIMPNLLDTYTGPVWIHDTYYSWGKYNPPQEFIDQFQMANGKDISDPASDYNDQNPYKSREKRFYDFIVYDGAPYKQNWMSTTDTIYFRIDKVHPSKNQLLVGGGDGTQTGYIFKKRLDNLNPPGGELSGRNHIYYRYGEVLLNYAEAQNEAVGPDASVYEAINAIRTRPGTDLPELQTGLTKDQMRVAILHERRIELMFEQKRLFDLWRWKIAEINLNSSMHSMVITNSIPEDNSGVWLYTRTLLARPNLFTQKMYFNPIPQAAIDRNPKLKQNWGY